MSVDYLPFSMEVAPTSVLTFYNGKEPIEQYAQRKAGFACFWEYLKQQQDAGLVTLFEDEDGHHAMFLERDTVAWQTPEITNKEELD
jgi:hypothetical protein